MKKNFEKGFLRVTKTLVRPTRAFRDGLYVYDGELWQVWGVVGICDRVWIPHRLVVMKAKT